MAVALIGAKGMLAQAVKKFAPDFWKLHEFDLPEFDLTDVKTLDRLRQLRPEVVVNCAAMTHVDGCESQVDKAFLINGEAPGYLATLVAEIGSELVHISTDFVFSGNQETPYREEDSPDPLSVYGKSKLLGEQRITQSGLEKFYILRTSWLYGAGGGNFVETMLRLAAERDVLRVVADQRGTPTWTDDLAQAIVGVIKQKKYGLYHYSNAGECSWHEFAVAILAEARELGLPVEAKEIVPISTDDYPLPATRPKYSIFSKEKISSLGIAVPDWRESLHQYFLQRQKG